MGRLLKIVGIVIAVLIVIVLVLPFLISVNQFRPTIEEKASAAVGRKVQVGSLSLSLFSGSLAADTLSIADDPKFSTSPFLTAKSVKVGVEIMPLIFSKTLNVTDIVIDSPQVSLIRGPAGQWNYSSLGASAAKSQSQQAPPASSSTPAASQKPTTSSAPPAASGPGTPFSVGKLELKDGRITIGSVASQKRSVYDHVNVTASNVSLTSKFPVTVTADLPGGGNFKLDGTAGPVHEQDTVLTPLSAKLTISSLNIASSGLVDPALGLGGSLDLNATLASQGGEAETKGEAKLSKALLVAGGSPATVPLTIDFNTKYNLVKNSGVLSPSTIKIGNAVAHLSGTYEIPAAGTLVNMKIEAQDMPAKDLQSFLPALGINLPKGASLQAGTLNTNLTLGGPVDKLITSGSVGLFAAKLAGFDLGSKLSAVSSLVGIKTGNDLEIEKLTTNLRMAPDGLKADNFDAIVPAIGTMVGGGTVDSKNNLDFKMAATLKNPIGGAAAAAPAGAAAGALGGLLGKVAGGAGGVGGALGGCKGAGGPTIPFQIQGTTSDPKFIPDVGGLAAGMLKSQLGCAGGLLPGGGAKGAQQQQNPAANPLGQLGGLFKKKKP